MNNWLNGTKFPAQCQFCKSMAVNLNNDRCRKHLMDPVKLKLIKGGKS